MLSTAAAVVIAVVLSLALVAAAVVAYFLARPKPTPPTFGEQLDRELTADLPKPKRPTEYVRDGRAVPVPPTAEELQAIADAHRRGNGPASTSAASGTVTGSATGPPVPSTAANDLAASLVQQALAARATAPTPPK